MVSAGGNFTCTTEKDTGRAYCWGSNSNSQLGIPSTEKNIIKTPRAIGSSSDDLKWSAISSGTFHACGIRKSDENLFCWGDNRYGQLGINSTEESTAVPTAVMPGAAFAAVAAGRDHTCGIMKNYSGGSDTAMYCWGSNADGQLGQGRAGVDIKMSNTPLYVSAVWDQVSSGDKHSCGFTPLGKSLACWGSNSDGQIGFGGPNATYPGPRPVSSINTKEEGYLSHPSLGTASSCAMTSVTKRIYCWYVT